MDSEDEEQDAMAASMGFSSFGAQSNKRRKYNSKTDAVIDKTKPLKAMGSGSNKTPLGEVRAKVRNGGDAAHKDGDVLDAQGAIGGLGKMETERADEDGDGDGPIYADESPPLIPHPTLDTKIAQRNHPLDQCIPDLSSSSSGRKIVPVPAQAPSTSTTEANQPASSHQISATSKPIPIHSSLPPKPPPPSARSSEILRSADHAKRANDDEAWRWRKGVKNENGDVAYYDASFVEDPWRELRGDKG